MLIMQLNALHSHVSASSTWLTYSTILIVQISLPDSEEIGEASLSVGTATTLHRCSL
jgi:hypothetical protein